MPHEYIDERTGFRVRVSGTAAGETEPGEPIPTNVYYNPATKFWERSSGSAVPPVALNPEATKPKKKKKEQA